MDIGFEKLKKGVETELGRPIEQGEEITIRALYFFGKGLKLKNQLDSEPERLGDICKRVLPEIRERMERNQRKHQVSVFGAVRDFLYKKLSRPKRLSGNRTNKQRVKEGRLF